MASTVGPGKDYSSLSAAEAALQADISAGPATEIECYAFEDTTQVNFTGWTTSATGYIRIYTPTAERHDGTPGTGYRLVAGPAFDRLFVITEQYVRLDGLAFKHTASTANTNDGDVAIRSYARLDGVCDVRIENCLIYGAARGAIELHGGVHKVVNCSIYGVKDGIKSTYSFSDPSDSIYNCTVSASNNGIIAANSSQTVKNCYVSATSGQEFSASNQTRTTCAHASASVWSSSTASIAYDTGNFVNVTAGSEDLHLASGASSTLKTGGTDLSADATYAFSTDIDGDTRSDWGIGVDELVAAAATANHRVIGGGFGGRVIC